MQTITLNNGVKMPILGYGVFQIDPKETQKCVEDALEVGYRLIDTAAAYRNEEAVGAAIKSSGIKREELFITTKLWIDDVSEAQAINAFESSMQKLGLEYLDLYLIHQPYNDLYGAWRSLSKLYKEGKIKAIGVSNFYSDRITDFCLHNEIIPALNQIECHPFFQKQEEQKILKEYDIAMQSWASFAEGKNDIFANSTLQNIGAKYGKSVAQVILRWLIQRQIAVIPKTLRKERMRENFNVFDFELDSSDMEMIAKLDENKTYFINHRDVESVKMLANYMKQ